MESPKISVVIPLYNKEDSVSRTLKSVLCQTYLNFEIVVVDDGSTDKSVDVVSAYVDERIRIIRKTNGGHSSARNRGIVEAQYKYIAFLDADDYWMPNYLEEQVRLIEDFPEASLWSCNWTQAQYLENGEFLLEPPLPTGLSQDFRGVVEDYFNIQGRVSDLICSSSVVIDKSIFDIAGMFDERIKFGEDSDMWMRIIGHSSMAFNSAILVYYIQNSENRVLSHDYRLKDRWFYYVGKYAEFKGTTLYSVEQKASAPVIAKAYFSKERADASEVLHDLDYDIIPRKYKYFFNLPYPVAYLAYVASLLKKEIKHAIKRGK